MTQSGIFYLIVINIKVTVCILSTKLKSLTSIGMLKSCEIWCLSFNFIYLLMAKYLKKGAGFDMFRFVCVSPCLCNHFKVSLSEDCWYAYSFVGLDGLYKWLLINLSFFRHLNISWTIFRACSLFQTSFFENACLIEGWIVRWHSVADILLSVSFARHWPDLYRKHCLFCFVCSFACLLREYWSTCCRFVFI